MRNNLLRNLDISLTLSKPYYPISLFDFFKKPSPEEAPSDSYILSTYAPALTLFRKAQAEKQMYEPIAAYLDNQNHLHGTLVFIKDEKKNITVEMALSILGDELNTQLQNGHIQSYAIFYHSCFIGQPGDPTNETNNAFFVAHEDYNAINLLYATKQCNPHTIICPYTIIENTIRHQPIHGFSSASPFDPADAEKPISFDAPIEYEDFEIRNESGGPLKRDTRTKQPFSFTYYYLIRSNELITSSFTPFVRLYYLFFKCLVHLFHCQRVIQREFSLLTNVQ